MSLHVFQWLRDFCASHSHFWAEDKPILCVCMEVCTQGKGRAGSILIRVLPELHCSSRSPKPSLLLSTDGKSKSGSQSNYCLGCLLCSLSGASPALQSRARRQSKSRQEQTLLSIPPPPKLEFLISHLDKRKLKGFTKSRVSASTAFGSDVPAAGMAGQGLVWDFPPHWFCFAFFQL